jgi:hypothetical protein
VGTLLEEEAAEASRQWKTGPAFLNRFIAGHERAALDTLHHAYLSSLSFSTGNF